MRGLTPPLVALFCAAGTVAAQPTNVTGGSVTVQSAGRDFPRQIRGLASEPAARWIAWATPAADGRNHLCCFDSVGSSDDGMCCGRCRLERGGRASADLVEDRSVRPVRLEAPSEVQIFFRVEAGGIRKIRAFSADCAVDAGALPIVWISGVPAEASVAWLESLAATQRQAAGDEGDSSVAHSAVAAIAHHAGAPADRALERLMARDKPPSLRRKAAFWLGNARGHAGYEALNRVVPSDPDEDFRKHATFALSQSREPEAVGSLIAMAKSDASPRVRGQALFWLAQKAGRKAAVTIEEMIRDDPDTEVKTKAVFALTQMPDGEGVPQLIHVARTNRNPEVRKKAVFWLEQSKDPRALAFFEEILTK